MGKELSSGLFWATEYYEYVAKRSQSNYLKFGYDYRSCIQGDYYNTELCDSIQKLRFISLGTSRPVNEKKKKNVSEDFSIVLKPKSSPLILLSHGYSWKFPFLCWVWQWDAGRVLPVKRVLEHQASTGNKPHCAAREED